MALFINEIHPNPIEGSEWIELWSEDCEQDNCEITGYQIFDSYHRIYEFDGQEVFSNQLLVIEVSGLNNDQDSVILKDKEDNILDSFSYTKTEKGLSWNKLSDGSFVLSEASPNLNNPEPTLTPTPTPTNTPAPTDTPTSTPTPTQNQNQNQAGQEIEKALIYQYKISNIKLESHDQAQEERLGRLVFLSKTKGQTYIVNAIIGSSLVVLSSILLIYVRLKGKNLKKLFSRLS